MLMCSKIDFYSFVAILSLLQCICDVSSLMTSYRSYCSKVRTSKDFKISGQISGQCWGDLSTVDKCRVLGPSIVLQHLGDYLPPEDKGKRRNSEYELNVGKAMEVLRRQLPVVFYASNLDFSIFAPQITVVDYRQNKMLMQKSLYVAAVKSLRVASTISSIYPSMNVRKVEYVEDCQTIQALVDVVLPDTMKVEGQVSFSLT